MTEPSTYEPYRAGGRSEGVRVGDVDRDRAAERLAEHYAAGRLDADEHAERLDAVWSARTRADLEPLFEDLPWDGRGGHSGRRMARPRQRRFPRTFLLAVAGLVALTLLTGFPIWLLAFGLGFWLCARTCR